MADHVPVPVAPVTSGWRPAFRRGVRLVHDQAREQDALLYPEGVLLLQAITAMALAEAVAALVTAPASSGFHRRMGE